MVLETFRFVKHYAAPYRWTILLGLVFVVLTVQGTAYIPKVVRDTLDHLEKGLASDAANPITNASGQEFLLGQALQLAAVAFAAAIGMFLMRRIIIGNSRRIEYDVRQDLYRHIQSLSYLTISRQRTGDIMNRATSDIEGVRMMCGPAVMHFTNTMLLTPTVIIYMVDISPILTLISFIPMVVMIFAVRSIGSRSYRRQLEAQARLSDVSARSQENFSGMRVVKAFVQEPHEVERFADLSRDYRDASIRVAMIRGLFQGTVFTLANLGVLLFVLFSPGRVLVGEIGFSDAIAFFAWQEMLIWPMMAFGWTSMLVQRGMASVNRLNEYFALQADVLDDKGAAIAPSDNPAIRRTRESSAAAPSVAVAMPGDGGDAQPASDTVPAGTPIEGTIQFHDVNFRYHDDGPLALDSINLTIPAGQTVAFMGPIGSGKTTLARMIPRLFDPSTGHITLDGRNLRDWRLEDLRRSIGYAPQDGFLFSETIAYNIAYGIDDAGHPKTTPDRAAQIRELVKEIGAIAQLDSDIEDFPYGYEQIIGERGVTLSGGQKQRVALARALLVDPRILILDDSFSAVDTDTEERILRGLRKLMQGRTTVLIAHRVSTVRDADRIFVLKDGRVIEEGTDAELMANNGFYAEMATKQRLEGEIGAL